MNMTKKERLEIEEAACAAIGIAFHCNPKRRTLTFDNSTKSHEFDIFAEDIVIGGVSTSPLIIGNNNINTGGCDRASSEFLWLSLWPGKESRVHVLSDERLAEYLIRRYQGLAFPHPITIFHYEPSSSLISKMGDLST